MKTAVIENRPDIQDQVAELKSQITSVQEQLQTILRGAGGLQVILPELHDKASGRIDAQKLAVYTGGSLTTLSEAGSSNDQLSYYQSYGFGKVDTGPSFNLQVTAGTVYQIALESLNNYTSGAVVLNVNQPPTIVSNATAAGTLGTSFSHSVQASNLPSGYTASGLPAG